MRKNIIRDKTFAFGKRIVKLCIYLEKNKKEYVLSKQLLRSGTSPGAMVRESEHSESRKDFIHKLSIALKEANESEYWLQLMKEGNYISEKEFKSIHNDCLEIIKILAAIIKTTKNN
ncbi:MAG TPA: four helix bundle protein [Phaeodactylibacter sp.]|nr:four helix bundle protein [Phaeodactylibacter sp.]